MNYKIFDLLQTTHMNISRTDVLLLLLLALMAILMMAYSKRLSQSQYSKLLIGIVIASAIITTLFQWYDVAVDGNTIVHSAIFSITQLAIYGLASKLWLKINYKSSAPHIKKLMHLLSHSMLLIFIVASYWIKSANPLVIMLVYPICGFSISLIEEVIEKSLSAQYQNKDSSVL